jgi:threonine/homoserine/homoserine lactone efflux protein
VCRYPNIACELLTSDVSQITEALTTDQKLLDKIMLFVDTDGLLNPLQTSFFSKVVGLLITRKSEVVGMFFMLIICVFSMLKFYSMTLLYFENVVMLPAGNGSGA